MQLEVELVGLVGLESGVYRTMDVTSDIFLRIAGISIFRRLHCRISHTLQAIRLSRIIISSRTATDLRNKHAIWYTRFDTATGSSMYCKGQHT